MKGKKWGKQQNKRMVKENSRKDNKNKHKSPANTINVNNKIPIQKDQLFKK